MAKLANMTYPVLRRRFGTAVGIIRTEGWVTGSELIAMDLLETLWLLGKTVELTGNIRTIDGARFDLSDPHISTRVKARFLLRTWETETRLLLNKYLPPDIPVIEFGGSVGVVACVTNARMDAPERHVVVEANPHAADILEHNRSLNGCRFEIVRGALAYGGDEVLFRLDKRIHVGKVVENAPPASANTISVPALSLASLLDSHGFARVALIADIEGAEHDLVAYEGDVLRESVEWLFVETHGFEDEIRIRLEDLGFELVEEARDRNAAYRNSALFDR